MKWDGEWHITLEVFRDLGIAFGAVLVLIYVLVVGWFRNFITPLTIMAPIPLTLVGILPAHGLMGAFFTATSMIGFIAGAGIIVRNSIILVDFIELRIAQGMPLEEAVVDAGAVRFRHPVRPDLPGPGHLPDGGRGGLDPAQPDGRSGVILHGETARSRCRAWRGRRQLKMQNRQPTRSNPAPCATR
jgi:hypothetical protein